MTPAIELISIDKRFGAVHANKDVTLTMAKGSIHGIIGENGAGKSTLMSILFGFYAADLGEIKVDGKPVRIKSSTDAIALASAWCTSTSCWSNPSRFWKICAGCGRRRLDRPGPGQGPQLN